jgi:hypothetical protein
MMGFIEGGMPPSYLGRPCGASVTVDLPEPPGAVRWLPREPSGTATPCVVLVDRAGCAELAELGRALARLGVPSALIDAASVPALRLTAPLGGDTLTLDGHRLAPTVVWTRHLSPRAFPGAADPAVTLLRAESWCALLGGPSALAPTALPGTAPGRLEQLAGAARAGLRTPRTIVTTDPGDAAAALTGERVVVKVLGEHFVEPAPGALVGVLPEIADRAEVAARPPLGFPVIVQEYVEHDTELRVYHLAGDVRAFAIGKAAPDALWRDAAHVSVTPVPTPPPVAAAVRRLAAAWGLTYGAFDLLLAGGEVVFLEANADGDWRWFEARAGTHAISAAAARMVRALHLAALRRANAPPPIGIIDFLLLGDPPGDRPGVPASEDTEPM